MTLPQGFHTIKLDIDDDTLFEQLAASVCFEDVTGGRAGNHLTRPGLRGTPIVRTTTSYLDPACVFTAHHDALIERIKANAASQAALTLHDEPFNHALIEIYDQRYTKMGYHSDQSLDLDPDAFIAVFSCYDRDVRGSGPGVRQLMVRGKETSERFTIPLEHGSVVLFSVEANARFSHKIILPAPAPEPTRWLGLTLRRSKTFVTFDEQGARLEDGARLTLADDAQRRAFYKLRGAENKATHFEYPRLDITLSEADLMPPVHVG